MLVALLAAGSVSAVPPPGVAIRDIGFKMKNLELPSGKRHPGTPPNGEVRWQWSASTGQA